jgi:hypothetical protein
MKYLVKFDGAFDTKEEAIAFANIIESFKSKLAPEPRYNPLPEYAIKRSLLVWESTHDEAEHKPCQLIMSVDFNAPKETHKVNGSVPTIEEVVKE